MHWYYTIFIFIESLTVLITAFLAVYSWRQRNTQGAMAFATLMIALMEWALTDLAYWLSLGEAIKIFWIKMQYFGIVSLPLAFFVFSTQYADRQRWLRNRRVIWLAIVPLITLIMVWTNQFHGLLWSAIDYYQPSIFQITSVHVIDLSYGPWFWVHVFYSYSLILLGSTLILITAFRVSHLYRGQAVAILLGVMVPWIWNVIYIFRLGPMAAIDFTPIAFTVTGLALAWSIFHYRFLDLSPIARNALIDKMDDGMIVLDEQSRVVDINPAALVIFSTQRSKAIGQSAQNLFTEHQDLINYLSSQEEARGEIKLDVEGETHYYELRVSPLTNRSGEFSGGLVVLHDFTKRKQIETELQEYQHHLEDLVAARPKELTEANELLQAEIVERQKVGKALSESESRYRMVSEIMSDFTYAIRVEPGGEMAFEWVTDSVTRITGYTFEELEMDSTGWIPFFHPEDKSFIMERYERLLSLMPDISELRIITKKGNVCWLHDHAQPIWDDKEKRVTRIYGASRDITETKQMELGLNIQYTIAGILAGADKLADAIQKILQVICDGLRLDLGSMWRFDSQSNTLWCVHTWHSESIDDLTLNTVCRETTFEPGVGLPGQVWTNGNSVWKADIPHEPYTADTPFATRLGLSSAFAFPLRLRGQVMGVIMVASCEPSNPSQDFMDMFDAIGHQIDQFIERKQAEEESRQSDARIRAFLNAIPDMIFRISSDGRFLDYRVRSERDLLAPPDAIIGRHLSDILPPDVAYRTGAGIKEALQTGEIQIIEYQLPLEDGTRSYESRLVASGQDEVLAIVRDVSERARLEMMKSDFINRASHELRTPLTTAILTADLIQEGGSEEEIASYWEILQTELERQRLLVERLLTVGRLESGNLKLNPGPLDLIPVIEEAINAVSPLALANDIVFEKDIASRLYLVNGDEGALQQVFINIFYNAIKFSDPGSKILIRMKQCIGDKNTKGVSVWVQDHGIGIPAADLPHLFTRFYRASNVQELEIAGSGVGLFIVKSIIYELGGQVTIESKENKGTTIKIWLPH